MSIIYHRQRSKKQKYPRNRISRKILHAQKMKKRIIKSRGWKLNYPEFFEFNEKYPYIVRINAK